MVEPGPSFQTFIRSAPSWALSGSWLLTRLAALAPMFSMSVDGYSVPSAPTLVILAAKVGGPSLPSRVRLKSWRRAKVSPPSYSVTWYVFHGVQIRRPTQ